MNELRRAADRLAKLGFTLVKLKPNSKQPADGCGWQQRATSDGRHIRQWRGDYNVGILCGTPLADDRCLLIIDVDDKNGKCGSESLRRLEADCGELPRTATAYTATGGRHLYLTVPADLPLVGISQRLAKNYPGVELLGAGLLAVAPPSVIAGGRYEWYIFPEEGLSEAPSWLLSRLKPEGRIERLERDGSQRKNSKRPSVPLATCELLREMVERYSVDLPGQRNDRMHRAVASLFAKQLSAEGVREVMLDWHRRFAHQIGTPWEDAVKLLDQCIASTVKKIEVGGFLPAGTTDHTKVCAQRNLSLEQIEELNDLLPLPLCPVVARMAAPALSPLTSKGGQKKPEDPKRKNRGKSLTRQESAFVLAFLLHSLYEISKGKGATLDSFPATKSQLLALLKEKFGMKLDGHGPQYRRLRDKFITKGERKASLVELVEMVAEGKRGQASKYCWRPSLRGIRDLFGMDTQLPSSHRGTYSHLGTSHED